MHAKHRLLWLRVIISLLFQLYNKFHKKETVKQQLCNYIYSVIIHKNTTFTQINVLFTVPQQLFVVCQKEEEVEQLLGLKWRLHYQMELEQVLTLSHPRGLELMPTV